MTLSEALARAMRAHPPGGRYLAGVSGGCDSMVMLRAMSEAGWRDLTVCHFDHGLRPDDASRERELVRRAARRLDYGFEHGAGDARAEARRRGMGIEEAARALRYRFFEACAAKTGCRTLFLGHHQRDQAETVLLHLARGSGLAGLGGMAHESFIGSLMVVRPLLAVSPEEIRSFARNRCIRFVEDPSNARPAHTRNRIRHRVLPAIEEACGPSSIAAIARAAEILRADNDWIESQMPAPAERLKVAELRALPLPLRRRLVLRWLRERGVPDVGYAETALVLSMLDSPTAKVNLPGANHARRRAGEIFFQPAGDASGLNSP